MKVGYARVSSSDQNPQRQKVILRDLGAEKIFLDIGSGKNLADRPALKEMLDFIRADDIVIVESISRLARCTKDLLSLIDKFTELGVVFISQKESLDTSTDTGRFMLTIFGAVSELERSYILSRQREGIELAKANGVYKGRKAIEIPEFNRVHSDVCRGVITATDAIRQLNVSKSTYYRRVRMLQRSAGNQSSV